MPFIVFEGLDGAGKSTQIEVLGSRLRNDGADVELVREPGGTEAGEAIRAIMFGPDAKPLLPLTWAFLMNSARAQLVGSRIRPCLARGGVVLADRYWYSTLAYQGGGEGLGESTIRTLADAATGKLDPDLVIYLDLQPSMVPHRKGDVSNELDRRPVDFHERVRNTYLRLVESEPHRWYAFDAGRNREELSDEIYQLVVSHVDLGIAVKAQ
jgi:dTMP kinase